MAGPIDPRALWRDFEAIHAVTYFAEESRVAASDAGLRGFWMGYFGFRAAPLGAVGPGTVLATFANFAPQRVQRAIPDAWSLATPEALIDARAASAAAALRRLDPGIERSAVALAEDLRCVAAAGDRTGRPLYAANLDVSEPTDPVAALWQWCTALREHRGDGHVAATVAHGLSGLHSHLLQVAAGVVPAEALREARGWTEDEWERAAEALIGAGLLAPDGSLTDAGRMRKLQVEETTDRLAGDPWAVLGDRLGDVAATLGGVADAVRASQLIPVPNPIGLS
jgi:hypothetical protein